MVQVRGGYSSNCYFFPETSFTCKRKWVFISNLERSLSTKGSNSQREKKAATIILASHLVSSDGSHQWCLRNTWLELGEYEQANPEYGSFQSRWRQRQTWLASSHNYIKITTKIQNNHHSGHSEIELNRSLTTTELPKPHPSKLVGGTQTQNKLLSYPCVVDKNSEGYLRSKQAQPHTRSRSPGFQCQEDKSPQLLATKISRDWVSGRNFWSPSSSS